MTSIVTSPYLNIIPTIESLIEKSAQKKIHPDILLETPTNLGLFSKNLITLTRTHYQNTGISSFEDNCISFGELDKFISLKKRLYYDNFAIKCYMAFDVNKLTETDIDSIAHAILSLTNKTVYLNRNGRKYPNFENLFDTASSINLFEDYSEQDKIEYSQTFS